MISWRLSAFGFYISCVGSLWWSGQLCFHCKRLRVAKLFGVTENHCNILDHHLHFLMKNTFVIILACYFRKITHQSIYLKLLLNSSKIHLTISKLFCTFYTIYKLFCTLIWLRSFLWIVWHAKFWDFCWAGKLW